MTLPTIALYGLGNIGFRHLQGLAPLASEVAILGVDPSSESRDRAQAAWRGHGRFLAPDAAPADPVDLAILATSAEYRLDLMRIVLARHRPQHLILEKVVFQSPDAFDVAGRLLRDAGAQAWVNCPRRQWPLHRQLRARLPKDTPFHITVSGRDWGLACNGVHFVDLLQFYSGVSVVTVAEGEFYGLLPSKRPGFYEVHGRVGFTSGVGLLTLSSLSAEPERAVVHLSGDGWRWRVDEMTGQVVDEETGVLLLDVGRPPYQGELTADAALPLLRRLPCPLATFEEGRQAHVPFLEALTPVFVAAGRDITRGLPIT